MAEIQSTTNQVLCACGCEQPTPIARKTATAYGHVKGQPLKFIHGHNTRKTTAAYLVDPATECWIWQRLIAPNGYGHTSVNGYPALAHRVYYERHKGPIPEGLQLDHLCRNRACVNPDHLEPVAQIENLWRGRGTRLSRKDIGVIKRMRTVERRSTQEIAALFNVSPSYVGALCKGITKRFRVTLAINRDYLSCDRICFRCQSPFKGSNRAKYCYECRKDSHE